MKERLSALIDGELESGELQAYLARIKADAELRGAWNTYHLIGDALRGNISQDLTTLVVARLRDEPTILAPRRISPAFRRMGWYVASAAAGLAAVTLVVWTALPLRQAETQVNAKSENVDLGRSALAPVATVSVPAVEVKASLSSAAVENYLYAHQPYSHASAMQGVAPYARTIADERGAGSQ